MFSLFVLWFYICIELIIELKITSCRLLEDLPMSSMFISLAPFLQFKTRYFEKLIMAQNLHVSNAVSMLFISYLLSKLSHPCFYQPSHFQLSYVSFTITKRYRGILNIAIFHYRPHIFFLYLELFFLPSSPKQIPKAKLEFFLLCFVISLSVDGVC